MSTCYRCGSSLVFPLPCSDCGAEQALIEPSTESPSPEPSPAPSSILVDILRDYFKYHDEEYAWEEADVELLAEYLTEKQVLPVKASTWSTKTSTFDCNRYLYCDDNEYDPGECGVKRGQHVHVGFRYHPVYSTGIYSRPEFINQDYKYLYVGYDIPNSVADPLRPQAGVPRIETMRVKIPRRQRRKWFHFMRRLNRQSSLDDEDAGQFCPGD